MLLLSRSLWRKLLATVLAACAFVLLYNATIMDSRTVALRESDSVKALKPKTGSRLDFTATAYCKGEMTSAGVAPQAGIAAADPLLLPEGSVVQVEDAPERYRGIYTVMDTGPAVIGRHVDLYMWSCIEATSFGRRPISLTILRLGWNPRNSAEGAVRTRLEWASGRAGERASGRAGERASGRAGESKLPRHPLPGCHSRCL